MIHTSHSSQRPKLLGFLTTIRASLRGALFLFMALYQNQRNGQVVEFIGHHDKDWAMVKNATGVVQYVALDDLVSYEANKGRTGQKVEPVVMEEKDEDKIPEAVIPLDTRLNVNVATAESLAKQVKGIGYATAKKIIELRLSLPGERFSKLDQLKKIARVDWEEVFKEDLIYIA
jgi:DNA uptake protein ComE-like DNA-binding protein